MYVDETRTKNVSNGNSCADDVVYSFHLSISFTKEMRLKHLRMLMQREMISELRRAERPMGEQCEREVRETN